MRGARGAAGPRVRAADHGAAGREPGRGVGVPGPGFQSCGSAGDPRSV